MSNNYGKCGKCGQPFHGEKPCGASSALSRFIEPMASPFTEGCNAYDVGGSLEHDNPYNPGGPDYKEWRDGWYASAECEDKY